MDTQALDPLWRVVVMERVVVVGGGVVGLFTAFLLAREGREVKVFEWDRVFGGASGASLGIMSVQLAVLDGVPPRGAFEAVRLHEEASSSLGYSLARADVAVPLLRVGRAGLEYLSSALSGKLRGARLARIPGLGLSIVLPGAVLVDPDEVARSLVGVLDSEGVEVREGTPVRSVVVRGNRVLGVELGDGSVIESELVVVTAGVWTDKLLGPLNASLGVHALKGYRVTVDSDSRPGLVVGADPVFVRPTQDWGSLMVGGFKVKAGIPESPGEVIVNGDKVREMVSAVAGLGFEPSNPRDPRTGLRPCLRRPYTGPVGPRGLIVSTGHCRHGILLAPLAALEASRHARKAAPA